MRITQEDDYALRTVFYLCKCEKGRRVEAKEISKSECIPQRFLLKLLRKLSVAGILKSYMGYGGGYVVEKEPSEISMLDVIVASEGPIYVNKCLEDKANCNAGRAEICVIHKRFINIQKDFLNLLDSVKISDLIQDEKEFKLKKTLEEQL